MIKKILLLLLCAAPLSMMAQKFGRFDYQAVVQALPDYKTAMDELQAIAQNYENDFADMQREYQTKLEKFRTEVNDKTPENIRQRREQELVDMQQKLQQAYEDNSKALQDEQQRKMQPILLKVQEAVSAVAKAAAQGSGIFINESLTDDVTNLVMKKLGISATTTTAGN